MTQNANRVPREMARARLKDRLLNRLRPACSPVASAVSDALGVSGSASRQLLCEPLEPRYLLSADILPLNLDHGDDMGVALRYDAATQVLELIEESEDATVLLDSPVVPTGSETLTITFDPSFGQNGALLLGRAPNGDGPLVSVTTGPGDDRVRLHGFDFDTLGFSVDTGGGEDTLTVEALGDADQALVHTHTGPQHGRFSTAQGGGSYSYSGVEQVELGTLADSHTITLTNDANLTLAQDVDGNLVAMVQHAFDAQTDLSALDGGDGFGVTGEDTDSQLGYAVGAAGDLNADGFDDLILGAPGHDAAYVLFGSAQGFDSQFDLEALNGSNGFVLTGPAGQNVGYSVGGGSDVNGDGIDDLIVGAPGPDGDFAAGTSYVLFGSDQALNASVDLAALDGANGFAILGEAAGDASGYSVAIVADINGDELGEIVIGAPGADPGGLVDSGAAYLLLGTAQPRAPSVSLADLDGKNGFALVGEAAGDALGTAVSAAGDVNNDALMDVAVGAPGADVSGADAGAAYVFFGAIDYSVAEGLNGLFFDTDPVGSLSEARAAIGSTPPTASFLAYQIDYPNSDAADTVASSTSLDDFLGLNVEELTGGDEATVDGSVFTFDGYLHVAEAGTYTFEVGSAEGFSLSINGEVVAGFDGTREFAPTASYAFAEAGFHALSLLYYTDSDPSGIELKSDLVTEDGSLDFISREYLFTNPPEDERAVADLDGSTGFTIDGEAAGDGLGTAVGTAGDVNADGIAEVIAGAPGSDAGGADSGRAYVVFGKPLTTVDAGFAATLEAGALDAASGLVLTGTGAGARAGSAVGSAGDLNVDGVADLVVGAPGSASQPGSVQVLFGDDALGEAGPVDLAGLDGVRGFSASLGAGGDRLGSAVTVAGDVDGDGQDDLVIGGPGAASGIGEAKVLFGRHSGGATTTTQYALPASAFTINGADSAAHVTLGVSETPGLLGQDISSDIIDFNGVGFKVYSGKLTVASGVTISTRKIEGTDYADAASTGDSGAITLSSRSEAALGEGSFILSSGASLYAHVDDASSALYTPGDIEIEAAGVTTSAAPIAAFNEGARSSAVTIDGGVTIRGGDITISSEAGVLPPETGMSAVAGGFTAVGIGALFPFTFIKALPVAVQVSIVEATIEIGNDSGEAVEISGSGAIDIGATSSADARGSALMWKNPFASGQQQYGLAVGVWVGSSSSSVTVHDGVTIESPVSDPSVNSAVSISADSTNNVGGSARVAQNYEGQAYGDIPAAPDNPNNRALAVGVAYANTIATVEIDEGASVLAPVGDVSITSNGTENVSVMAGTRSYKNGQAGIALGIEIAESEIKTLIDGTVVAGGSQAGEAVTFDPFTAIDAAQDTIAVGLGHGYQTGDRIKYSPGIGRPIDGLEPQATYYVIVVPDTSGSRFIQLADTFDDAKAGDAVDLIANPMLVGASQTLPLARVGKSADVIAFGFAHGFDQGEAVVYQAAEGKRIGGLIDGETYYVVLVEDDDTMLQLSTNAAGTNLVDLDNSLLFRTDDDRELLAQSVDAKNGLVTFDAPHGLTNGDAIELHSGFGFQLVDVEPGIRFADETTFYAIVAPSAEDTSQLDPNRIRLARTADAASTSNGYSNAIVIAADTATMTGTEHSLQPTAVPGITATAALDSDHSMIIRTGIGGDENPIKRAAFPEFAGTSLGYLTGFFNTVDNPQLDDAANGNQPLGAQAKTGNNTIELAASIGYLDVDRTVQVVIGSHAELKSKADIMVSAWADEDGNFDVEAGASSSQKNEVEADIGAAVSVSTYEAVVQAVVNGGAEVDAAGTLTVAAENYRRFPLGVDSPQQFLNDLLNDLKSDPFTTLADLNLALLDPLFQTAFTHTEAVRKGEDSKTEVAVAFAFQLSFEHNTTDAVIADGAQINQGNDSDYRSDQQSVTVDAKTELHLVDMAGIYNFGLDLLNVVATLGSLVNDSLEDYADPLLDVGVQADGGAFGTSLQWVDLTNRTKAAIGGSSPVNDDGTVNLAVGASGPAVMVSSGVEGDVSVTAHDTVWHFSFVDTAAKTKDGDWAFAGSGAIFRYNPGDTGYTEAKISSGAVITGGSVSVRATDQVILISQNGDLSTGDSTVSVGAGVSYLELNRRVRAYVGDLDGTSTAISRMQLADGAQLDVTARSEGTTVGFALAGAVRSDPPPADEPAGKQDAPAVGGNGDGVGDGANPGKSGWAIAGDAVVIDLVVDQVLAFIDVLADDDDDGNKGFQANGVTVEATNANNYVSVAGAFAVARTDYTSSSNKGLAGSFAGIELHRGETDVRGRYDSDTLAYIRRLESLEIGDQGLQLTADRRGVYWVTAAGGSGVSRGSGIEVAGSAAWTDLDYATRAYVENATLSLAGDSAITARDRVAVIAFAGDGIYKGSLGFGTAWAWNEVDRRVQATVLNSDMILSTGTLTVDALLWDVEKDNGRTLLPSAYAVAATLGIGDQNKTAVELTGTVAVNRFNTRADEPAVEASIQGSTISYPDGATDTTGVSLSAIDNSNLLALGGAVDGDAKVTIGVAAAVNELNDQATAFVEDSVLTVNKGGVSVEAVVNPEMNAFALGLALSDKNGVAGAGSGAENTAAGLAAEARVARQDEDTSITGAGSIRVHGEISYTDITAGAGAFGIQRNGNAGAALGAAVAVNDLSNNVAAAEVANAQLDASGDIEISASSSMAPDGVVLGLAVGFDAGASVSVDASVVDNTVAPTTRAAVTGKDAQLIATAGDISVVADEEDLVVSSGTGMISGTTGAQAGAVVGASVATNTVDSTLAAYIETAARSDGNPSVKSTAGSVTVSADRDNAQIVAVALGGEKAQDFALGGSVATNTVTQTADAHVSSGTQVSAADSVTVAATEESPVIVAAAGNFSASNEGVAIGAAVPTNTVTRDLRAYVGDMDHDDFAAGRDGAGVAASETATVSASRSDSLLLAIGVSGEGAQNFALGGSVVENNIKSSTVDAHVWGGSLEGDAGININAGDTRATNIAGAGNLDLSFLFRSGGANEAGGNAGDGAVNEQGFIEKASSDAEEEDAGSDAIGGQASQIVDNGAGQQSLNPQERANPQQFNSGNQLIDFINEMSAQESSAVSTASASEPTARDAALLADGDGVSVGIALANNLSRDTTVTAFASDAVLESDAGSIAIDADQGALFVTVAGSGSASGSGVSLDATEATTDYRPTTRAWIDAVGSDPSQVIAEGNVTVAADALVHGVTVAGNAGFDQGGTSVALGFATTAYRSAITEAYVDNAVVTANANTADAATVAKGVKGEHVLDDQFHGVSVTADARQVFTTVAAGIELAAKTDVAASVSMNLIGDQGDQARNLITRAYIGAGATVNEDTGAAWSAQSVNLFAYSDTTVHGGGGALGISSGSTWGGGAGADGGRIAKLTEAYIAAPTLNARNLVLVQAYSEETLASYEGSIQLSQGSELAGALGVYLFDLATHAYVADGSDVSADGSVLVAAVDSNNVTLWAGTVGVSTGGVTVGASIAYADVVADTRAWIAEGATVKGLAAAGTDTIAAATGDFSIIYNDDVADDGSELAPPGNVPTATTGDGELSADDPAWTQNRKATAEYSDIRGVAVTANSTDTVKGYVGTIGGSKDVAVAGALLLPFVTRTTEARISGSVNPTDDLAAASADQDVVVSAGSDFHSVGVTGVLGVSGGSGGAVLAPSVSWHTADLTTQAYVDDGASVMAGGDVLVVAAAHQHVTRVTAGIAGSGGDGAAGVEASVTGLNLTSTTSASVGADATVAAVGNLLISASDDTAETGVAGGLAIAIAEVSGAIGAGVVYTQIDKTTAAYIDENAVVDAGGVESDVLTVLDGEFTSGNDDFSTTTLNGVAVQAQSSETLTNWGIAGSGAGLLGVAGGVTYTNVDSDTSATIAKGAQVNQTQRFSASGAQSVNVSAANHVEVIDVGGAGSVGLAAITGGISVGVVRNSTTASIAPGANVSARRDLDVHAAAIKDLRSYALSVAAGGVGVSGSVSVWAIGDTFSPHYDTVKSSGNDALAIQDTSDTQDPGYASVYQSSGTQRSYIDGQANRSDAVSTLSGYANPDDDPNQANLIALRDQGSTTLQTNSDAQASSASDTLGKSDLSDVEGVTEASVAGTVEAGRDLQITAREFNELRVVAGGGELGGVGVGASVAVTAIRGAALAHLDGEATVGGDLVIQASRRADYHSDAIIGQAGLAAAGAGVGVVVDRSVQSAYIDDGAVILKAGSIQLSADRSYVAFEVLVVEAQLGLGGAIGASIASARVLGATQAYIGDASIGDPDAASAPVGEVRIEATSAAKPKARAYAGSGGLTLAGDGARADAYVTPTVEAYYHSTGGPLASGSAPDSVNRIGGDLTIAANSTAEPNAVTLGIAVAGGVAVPVSLPMAIASPTVRAYLGSDSQARVVGNGSSDPESATGQLTVLATAADDPRATGSGAAGAVGLAFEDSVSVATNQTTLHAYIGDGATVTANTDVIVRAEQEYVGFAKAWGLDFGLLSVGGNKATLTIEPSVQAYIGTATVTAGQDIEVVSESGEPGSLPELSFDTSTSVDYANNIITFGQPHGLETGDSVIYRAVEGSPIPGLEDGLTYDVIRVSGTQIKLGALFTADDVDPATGEIRFDRPHALASGAPVLYDNNGNPSVNGLVPGVSYFVNSLNPGVAKVAATAAIADNTEFGVFNGHDDVNLATDEIRLPVAYLKTGGVLTFDITSSDLRFVLTNQTSTSFKVGDAVLYAPSGSVTQLRPLDYFGVYYIAEIQKNTNGYIEVALAYTPAEALAGRSIQFQSSGVGSLIGVDASSWQMTGAGVNSPGAFVFGGNIGNEPKRIYSWDEVTPFPFETGDLVVWTRADGDYSSGKRFGLLPHIAYYASVGSDDIFGPYIQFAESLEDLANENFVSLTNVLETTNNPSAFDSFLSPLITIQTGDALTYHAPQAIPVSGEDINVPGTGDNAGFTDSLQVKVAGRLYTTLLDLNEIAAEVGNQQGLLGSWYRNTSISNLSDALAFLDDLPPAVFVAGEVNYPRHSATTNSSTTLESLLDVDSTSLVGYSNALGEATDHTVFNFEGYLKVEKAGTYEFEVRSDDGFQLKIGGHVVSEFTDQRAYAATKANHTFDTPGFYPIQLVYFNVGGNLGLEFRSNLAGRDSTGQNLIVGSSLLNRPTGLIYDGPATTSGTDVISPLERGGNYGFLTSYQSPDLYGLYMPLLESKLAPNADAQASVHQFRLPDHDPIDGLVEGKTYYLIVDGTRPGFVRLADSRADAQDGIAIDLGRAPMIQVPVDGVRTSDGLGGDAIEITDHVVESTGWEVAAAGDFNGDLQQDLLVRTPGYAAVVYGTADSAIDLTDLDPTRWAYLRLPGSVLAGIGDVNNDGVDDIAIGDADANQIHVVLGSATGFPGTINNADFVITGAATGDRLGAAIAGADINGDGVSDLIMGAPGTERTYVVYGGAALGVTGSVELGILGSGGNGLQGAFYDTDKLPTLDEAELASRLNAPDLLFTSTALNYPANADTIQDSQGLAALLGSDAPAGTPSTDLTGSLFTYRGYLNVPQAGSYTFQVHADDGFRLRIGDQVITEKTVRGAYDVFPSSAQVSFERAGLVPIELVHWEYGGNTGIRLESNIGGSMAVIPTELLHSLGGFVIEGAASGSEFGSVVASAGDLNADGVEDLAVSAPAAADGAGKVYLLYGAAHARGTSLDLGSLNARTGGVIQGAASSAAGTSLAGLGDVNGDGFDDVVVSVPNLQEKAYVVFGAGRFDTPVELGSLHGDQGFAMRSTEDGYESPALVSAAGDLNADGLADLAFSQPGVSDGAVYVIYGSRAIGESGTIYLPDQANGLDGFAVLAAPSSSSLGSSLAAGGDVNGDGVSDLIIGKAMGATVLLGAPSRVAIEEVDADTDTVRFDGASALATGDALYYTGAAGVHIGGVAANTVYYAIVAGSGDAVQLALTASDAVAGTAIDLDLSPRLEIDDLGGSFTVQPGSQVNTLTFDAMPAVENGQAVVYREAWGTRLVGLEDGATYYAIVSDALPANSIRLSDSAVGALNSDGTTNYLLFHLGAEQTRGTHYLGVEGLAITPPGSDLVLGAATDADDLDGVDGLRLDGATANGAVGTAVTGVGDVNGDGLDDALLLGSSGGHLVFGFEDVDVSNIDLGSLGSRGVDLALPGQATGLVGDLNGDTFADIVIGNPSAGNDRGEVSVVFGSPAGFGSGITVADLTISGLKAGDLFGTAVAGLDINDDGTNDLVIGAAGADDHSGAVYVVFGGEDLGPAWQDAVERSAPLNWYQFNETGSSVDDTGSGGLGGTLQNGVLRTTGAIDGALAFDGIDDFVALNGADLSGAWTAEFVVQRLGDDTLGTLLNNGTKNTNDHALRLVQYRTEQVGYTTFGVADYGFTPSYTAPVDEFVHLAFVNDPATGVTLYVDGEFQGQSPAPIPLPRLQISSDRDDIGAAEMLLDEVVVFNRALTGGEIAVHAASVHSVRPSIAQLDGSNGFVITGAEAGGEAGLTVSSAGDVNSDLVEDLVFGAPGIDRAYVLFGGSGSFAATLSAADLSGRGGIVLVGGTGTRTGQSVGTAGDVDGDGADEVLIGAPGADPGDRDDAGQSYLVFGSGRSFPSAIDLTSLDGSTGLVLNGVGAGDSSGAALGGVGDVNGDKLADFMIGAPLAEASGVESAGSAYLVFGGNDLRGTASIDLGEPSMGGVTFNGNSAGDALGTALAGAGDFNGDQVSDLILGAPNVMVDGRASAGRAYVVFGTDPNAPHYLVHDLTAPPKSGVQRLEQSRDAGPSELMGTPTVTATGIGGNLAGSAGATSTANINPVVRSFIGSAAGFDTTASGAQVTAARGDLYMAAFSATDVTATATGYDVSLLAGGGSANTTVTMNDLVTEAYVGRDAVVDAQNGQFTLLATTHDTLTGTSQAGGGGVLDFFNADATVTSKRLVQTTVGADATITAENVKIDALKSTSASSSAAADAGGGVVVPSSSAILTVGESQTPTVKVLLDDGSKVTATVGAVSVRAANFDEDSSARDRLSATAHSRSYGLATGQDSTARITLNEYAQTHVYDGVVDADDFDLAVELDWSQLNVDATGKTRSLIGIPVVHATLEGTVQGGNFNSDATSYVRQIGQDVNNDADVVNIHTLASYSVFWFRLPASHPNEVYNLTVDPLPPQPPPAPDAVEGSPATPPPTGPLNSVPESLSLEPGSLEVGGIRVGDELRIGGTFFDADLDDVHTVTVDWGDGTAETLTLEQAAGGGRYYGGHAYQEGGIYDVQVTVTDDAGDVVTDRILVPVTGMRLHEGVLQIVGTAEADQVEVARRGHELVVRSDVVSGRQRFALDAVDAIYIGLGDGDDVAAVSNAVTVSVTIDGGAGNDALTGGRGDDVLLGGSGDDRLDGAQGDDRLFGQAGWDLLLGGQGGDLLDGGEDHDLLAGEQGRDTLLGRSGNDILLGGPDHDLLDGGADDDWLFGGAGPNQARYAGPSSDYRINKGGLFGVTTITDIHAEGLDEGTDRLAEIDVAEFEDRSVVLNRKGKQGSGAAIEYVGRDPWIRVPAGPAQSKAEPHWNSFGATGAGDSALVFDEVEGRFEALSDRRADDIGPVVDGETGWALYGFDQIELGRIGGS